MLVLRRRADAVGEVPEKRLGTLLAARFLDRSLQWIAGQLLNEPPLGGDYERRFFGHFRDRAAQGHENDPEDQQQQDQMQHPAQSIEEAPKPASKAFKVAH